MQEYADVYLLQSHYTRTSLQRGLIVPIRPRWREVAAPEAAVTVFSTPDDGCCDTRNI